jgi:hypothetical protein
VETLAVRLDVQRADDASASVAVHAGIAAAQARAEDAIDRLDDAARMLSRLAGQQADVELKAGERFGRIESALAELQASASRPATPGEDFLEAHVALAQRIDAMDMRLVEAIVTLRADLTRLVDDSSQRLTGLEQAAAAADPYNIAVEFAELRRRVEERILGVEQRNVRTLEQLSDTVALLETRLGGSDAGAESA